MAQLVLPTVDNSPIYTSILHEKSKKGLATSTIRTFSIQLYCCAQIGINSFDSVFVESDAKSYAFESFCKVQPDWINLVVKKICTH